MGMTPGCCLSGHVNVAPKHLTAEAESLLSATLIHEVKVRPFVDHPHVPSPGSVMHFFVLGTLACCIVYERGWLF